MNKAAHRFWNKENPLPLEEAAKRAEAGEAGQWCDDCGNFVPKEHAAESYNPCSLGHEMKFHAPRDMGEVQELRYGFYRLACVDRL